MTIRATIMLLAVPLFLALAAVNGALLHYQEENEFARALDEQALAVAVTAAEFIAEMANPAMELSEPMHRTAIARALDRVDGLDGLYLIEPGQPPSAIAPAAVPWDVDGLQRPTKARSLGLEVDGDGNPWVTAVAPAGPERFVAVRMSARAIIARMQEIRQLIVGIVLVLGLFAAGLSWFVARRITRELRINREALAREERGEADATGSATGLKIREAHDLADAVRLMDASRGAIEARSRIALARRERERNADSALKDLQRSVFAAHDARIGGADIALRLCGAAPAGSFFACTGDADHGALVLGNCSADTPFEALADAMTARRLIENATGDDNLSDILGLLRSAFRIDALEVFEWTRDEFDERAGAGTLIALAEEPTRTQALAYGKVNAGIAPDDLLSGLEILLSPTGVFAALRPASAAGTGDHGTQGDFGRDRDARADAAGVGDFAH